MLEVLPSPKGWRFDPNLDRRAIARSVPNPNIFSAQSFAVDPTSSVVSVLHHVDGSLHASITVC